MVECLHWQSTVRRQGGKRICFRALCAHVRCMCTSIAPAASAMAIAGCPLSEGVFLCGRGMRPAPGSCGRGGPLLRLTRGEMGVAARGVLGDTAKASVSAPGVPSSSYGALRSRPRPVSKASVVLQAALAAIARRGCLGKSNGRLSVCPCSQLRLMLTSSRQLVSVGSLSK